MAALAGWEDTVDDEFVDAAPMLLNQECKHCGALYFASESNRDGSFTLCCGGGRLRGLTQLHHNEGIAKMKELFGSAGFRRNARKFNAAFAFATLGSELKASAPQGEGPRIFIAQGHVFHTMPRLDNAPQQASGAQAYFLDPDDALDRRGKLWADLPAEQLREVQAIIDKYNPYAALYVTVREQLAAIPEEDLSNVCLRFATDESKDPRRYNEPVAPEVAVVFEGEVADRYKDVMVRYRDPEGPSVQRVNPLSDHLDPLTYPLLFVDGQPGWHPSLQAESVGRRTNTNITPADFFAHRLMLRRVPPKKRITGKQKQQEIQGLLHSAGKLFQQYVVDAFCRIDWLRLRFYETHQPQLRAEKLSGLMDFVEGVDEDGPQDVEKVGKQVLLPSSHLGSPRDLRQRYLNAMTIVRKKGKPDLFLTMTCNPTWPEIKDNLGPGEQANDRPDLIARVFNMKLKALLEDLLHGHVLGKVAAYTYAVEFQKRGLPHVHILIILEEKLISLLVPSKVANGGILHNKMLRAVRWTAVQVGCSKTGPAQQDA